MSNEAFDPLLSAWAETLQHRMPCLQSGLLRFPGCPDPAVFYAQCGDAAQDVPSVLWEGDVPGRPYGRYWRIRWYHMEDWFPGTELEAQFRAWVGDTGTVSIKGASDDEN